MKLVVVVDRYGADINGGAELHARYVAERLSAHADVRVLTTCARDYVTWHNDLPPGDDRVNGIPYTQPLTVLKDPNNMATLVEIHDQTRAMLAMSIMRSVRRCSRP